MAIFDKGEDRLNQIYELRLKKFATENGIDTSNWKWQSDLANLLRQKKEKELQSIDTDIDYKKRDIALKEDMFGEQKNHNQFVRDLEMQKFGFEKEKFGKEFGLKQDQFGLQKEQYQDVVKRQSLLDEMAKYDKEKQYELKNLELATKKDVEKQQGYNKAIEAIMKGIAEKRILPDEAETMTQKARELYYPETKQKQPTREMSPSDFDTINYFNKIKSADPKTRQNLLNEAYKNLGSYQYDILSEMLKRSGY